MRAGNYVSGSRAWDDMCPVHGVGTEWFRSLRTLPYGFGGERETTREEWLELREREAENRAAEEARWAEAEEDDE